jgi:hypothetical protein
MSRLLREDDQYLFVRAYIHGNNDAFSDWEITSDGYTKYLDVVHEAEHFALMEISVEYQINKETGEVTYLSFNT